MRNNITTMTTLSASGSRNLPSIDTVLVFLAMCPSTKSVAQHIANNAAAMTMSAICAPCDTLASSAAINMAMVGIIKNIRAIGILVASVIFILSPSLQGLCRPHP